MTREEIIKKAIDYLQSGRFSCCKETYDEIFATLKCFADTGAKYVNYQNIQICLNEKSGRFSCEYLLNQWEPEPTPWYQRPFACRSLL